MYCTITEMRRFDQFRGLAQLPVAEPANLADLPGADPMLLHNAARGGGAVGGEFPVTVLTGAGKGPRIGVALDQDGVRKLAQLNGQP
jgi:hypothetical protein